MRVKLLDPARDKRLRKHRRHRFREVLEDAFPRRLMTNRAHRGPRARPPASEGGNRAGKAAGLSENTLLDGFRKAESQVRIRHFFASLAKPANEGESRVLAAHEFVALERCGERRVRIAAQ